MEAELRYVQQNRPCRPESTRNRASIFFHKCKHQDEHFLFTLDSSSGDDTSPPPSPELRRSGSGSATAVAQFLSNTSKKVVSLHITPRGRTRPSVSADGLKVETFFRVAGIMYTTQTVRPTKSSKHPPFILEPRKEGASSIMDHFRHLNFGGRDIDRNLSADQKALSRSIQALLEVRFILVTAARLFHFICYMKENFMACHNAVHFFQNGGKYYKDIIGAYPGFFGATAFKAMVNNQVKSAKAKGLDRLSKAEVTRRGLDDLRAVSREFFGMC